MRASPTSTSLQNNKNIMYQTMSFSGITDYHHHRHHHSTPPPLPPSSNNTTTLKNIERMSQESAVVIFSISTCCMCHAIKRLFCSMGVHPTVYELDQLGGTNYKEIETALLHLSGVSAVPVVFIGGKLVGSMDRVMGCHINGSLVPLLKNAGALWL